MATEAFLLFRVPLAAVLEWLQRHLHHADLCSRRSEDEDEDVGTNILRRNGDEGIEVTSKLKRIFKLTERSELDALRIWELGRPKGLERASAFPCKSDLLAII